MTYMNEEHVKAVFYHQISDSLQLVSYRCDTLYQKGQKLIEGYENEIKLQSVVITKEHELGEVYKGQYETEQKKNRKLRTWMGVGGAGAGAIILALVIGFLAK